MTATLAEWRQRLKEISKCPWPGARPISLERDGVAALHLRDRDARSIIRTIEESDVVVLSGESGVGKSSLLAVGVTPQLQQRGFHVIQCSDWALVSEDAAGEGSGRDLVQATLARHLPAIFGAKKDFNKVLLELDDRDARRIVVVLDQFEELLRYEPTVAREVLDWVEDVIAQSNIRVLLSLRAEYSFRVVNGLQLGAARLQHVQVEALTDSEIARQIVTKGSPDNHDSVVSKSAVRAIVSAWETASHFEVGLLHLQALMWSLWMRKAGERIEVGDVQKMIPRAVDRAGACEAFSQSLAVSVQIALDQCQAAGEASSGCSNWTIDAALQARAAGSIARVTPHLSNDGYKVNREREALARLALFPTSEAGWAAAMERARPALNQLRSMVDDPNDSWLSIARIDLLPRATDYWPWKLDPGELTAGPLLGTRPEDAVFESFRAYYFGLEWLRTCAIVRISRTARSRVMVSLIHDGFADGLNLWRQGQRLGLDELTTRFTATRGESLAWPTRPANAADGRAVHSNLRIQHSEITGRIDDTTFVNCDFRGTLVRDCTLEGVIFVNCILDDVQFTRCSIVGTPTQFDVPRDVDQEQTLPGYVVSVTDTHARSLAWYRGMSGTAAKLHSATAGLAALPVENSEAATGASGVPRQGGGVSIVGGRISSLKFRQCEFFNDGAIVMSQTAGTSVEFADQDQLSLRCDAVTLRAITFTTPLQDLEPLPRPYSRSGRQAKPGLKLFTLGFDDSLLVNRRKGRIRFELAFDDSLLSNLWFSRDMVGRARFTHCIVWQLFNAGDDQLAIRFRHDSGVVGLVNAPDSGGQCHDDPSQQGLGSAQATVDFARSRIDYRAHPTDNEVLELTETIRRVSPSFFPPPSLDDLSRNPSNSH